MVKVELMNEKAVVKKKKKKSVRDLLTLKLKIPLGNPNLKLVHTNQFMFTELPETYFELANLSTIGKVLNSEYSRYSGYQFNRWYIESISIENNKTNAYMELTLNPFASSHQTYKDNLKGFQKEYTNIFVKTSNKDNTIKSTGNTNLKDVDGFNKSDQEFIKKVVGEALQKRNNPINPIPMAYAIYSYYRDNHVYAGYECMQKMNAGGFESTWKNPNHNCGDGAATICAMYRCAGFEADIMHKYGHFYVRVKVEGEWYYCDQAGGSGQHNWRNLGRKGNDSNVFGGIDSSASVVGYTYC